METRSINYPRHEHGFWPTLVLPVSSLSSPFPFQTDINPHRSIKLRSVAVRTHSEGILVQLWVKHRLPHVRETLYVRERVHDWARKRNFFYFFTSVLNWFCCLLPSNCNPLWKALFLPRSITKDTHSVFQTHVSTTGQLSPFWKNNACKNFLIFNPTSPHMSQRCQDIILDQPLCFMADICRVSSSFSKSLVPELVPTSCSWQSSH